MRNALAEAGERVVVRLNATDLVWLAETADGKREIELTLVRDKDGNAQLRKELEAGDEVATEIKVKTGSSTGIKRIPVLGVTIQPENCEPVRIDSSEGWDAVFWTESAIEKFLYPYYHTQRLWNRAMSDLKDQFDRDPRAVALMHKAPSASALVEARAKKTLQVGKVVDGPDAKPTCQWMSVDDYLGKR